MCGICGKFNFKDIVPDRELIKKMCKTIEYRGPDDEGIYTSQHIGLGQRRLSIIDLVPTSCPPLANEDNSIWIVFNGEIYNYKELRNKLIKNGHKFRTHSDTEVIIHLYEDFGEDCLLQLNGMFAFAIWNNNKKILFCARDRFGKKPFFYTKTNNSFVFGSEIKAITSDHEIICTPDYYAIDLYLTYQFVPSPYSAFNGIQKLKPAEYLLCDINGNVETKIYWEIPSIDKSNAPINELEKNVLDYLRESVKMRMVADVPLGAFLSGGIDSGTIVALMAEESSKPIKTFSIGFEEESHNELPYARLVAKRYCTDHHELIIKPNAAEILPLLVQHYNEPFADSSAIPTYYVSKITSEYVKVALSGDGGDECFAGYQNYASINTWEKWNHLPLHIRKIIAASAKKIIDNFTYNNNISRIRRGLSMIESKNIRERRLLSGTILKNEEKKILYTNYFKNQINDYNKYDDPLKEYQFSDKINPIEWLMNHDLKHYLPDCLMVKSDIASMANSLEVRCPFLDYKFVEFVSTIPVNLKRNSSGSKIILKNAVTKLLPNDILNKPKTGFSIPISKWLREDLSFLLKDTLLSKKFEQRGLFNQIVIKNMIYEHINSKRDWSNRLWAFLILELWFLEFID